MKIFITGGTGYIGRAVVRELVEQGHNVSGLVRSESSADLLSSLGGKPVPGNLADPSSYLKQARKSEGAIHLAADYSRDTAAVDRTALEALLTAADGDGPDVVVYTSGCWVLGDTGDEPADENAPTEGAADAVAWRPPHEGRVLGAASQNLATAVVRPGMVYGGGEGIVNDFFVSAMEDGAAAYVGDGENRWSLVHRDDLAVLYRLLVENGARGVFHATDGESPGVRELAEAASEAAGAGGEVRRVALEDARKEMGPVADAICLDQVIVSPRSRKLGWEPEHPPFLEHTDEIFAEFQAARG